MVHLISILESNDLVSKEVVEAFKSCSSPRSYFLVSERGLSELFSNPNSYLEEFIKSLKPQDIKRMKPYFKKTKEAQVTEVKQSKPTTPRPKSTSKKPETKTNK